eukprot:scaffold229039_cov40-Cyclotella_meneghiniana.AAC.1
MKLFISFTIFTAISADVVSSINVNYGSHPSDTSKSTNHDSHVAVTSGSYNHQDGSTWNAPGTYSPDDHDQYGPNDGSTSWNPDDSTSWNPDWSPNGSPDQSDGSVWDPPASADDQAKHDGVHIRGDVVAQLRGTMKSS